MTYCASCREERRWYRSASLNGDRPPATYWRCVVCGYERLQLADVTDVAQLCRSVLYERRLTGGRTRIRAARGGGRNVNLDTRGKIDYEDALGHLLAEAWAVYRRWEPDRTPSFLTFAGTMLRFALVNWLRENVENRGVPKLLASAESLEALAGEGDEGDEYASLELREPGEETGRLEELPPRLRRIVDEIAVPIALGLSHREVAEHYEQTERWVSDRLREVRRELTRLAE